MADAAKTETVVEAGEAQLNGIKRVLSDATTRLKGFQTKLIEAGEDGKKRIEGLKGQLKLDELLTKLRVKERAQELVSETVEFTEETADKLGIAKLKTDLDKLIAKLADVDAIGDRVDKLVKRLETVRKRATDSVSKKEFSALTARVDALEKAASA